MNTTEFNSLYDTLEPFNTFDGARDLYYRFDLVARYDYLIETSKRLGLNTQNWVDAHRQELQALQFLLYKVPQTAVLIVSEKYRHEYCKNLLKAYICTDDTFVAEDAFVAKYVDIDTIAKNVANDMQRIEVNGRVFYWLNRADF